LAGLMAGQGSGAMQKKKDEENELPE
jgi:hypothetical protein